MERWDKNGLAPRPEAHYGDHVVNCFANRPHSLHGMFAVAVAKNSLGEALVDGSL